MQFHQQNFSQDEYLVVLNFHTCKKYEKHKNKTTNMPFMATHKMNRFMGGEAWETS